jgi:hypothetical protein
LTFSEFCHHNDGVSIFTAWFKKHLGLVLVLLALIVLRVPNFFEPYWYGDEAIYLTIGNALNQGEKLYAEIVDHKTPLIYYLARVPDQIGFRWLLLGWMLVTTTLFYSLAHHLFKKSWLATLATTVFMLFTTLPWLEGNIPNGELFVLGFVLLGAVGFIRTQIWRQFIDLETTKTTSLALNFSSYIWLFFSGAMVSLGILTKVPAILDLGSFLLVFWFLAIYFIFYAGKKQLANNLKQLVTGGVVFMAGVLTPILLSVIYFVGMGIGQAYLNFGLLYNLHYTQTWKLNLGSAWLEWAFTMLGKTSLMAAALVIVTLLTKKIKPGLQFVFGWFVVATFAMLLSNRPYPHYFIQIVPAVALLVAYFAETLANCQISETFWHRVTGFLLPVGAIGLVVGIMVTLHAGLYETGPYYQRFLKLQLGQISKSEYDKQFDGHVADNQAAAAEIAAFNPHRMFIWGTNPMLYAQTKVVPAGRFTVAFHIQDLKVYDQTIAEIQAAKPEIIIVMKGEENNFPALNQLISTDYLLKTTYPTMTLYRRLAH